MDRRGRFVSILILSVWSLQTNLADPISSGFDVRNFQALISANLDTCNMKIKITDTKYSAPMNRLSPTIGIASVPTNPTPTPRPPGIPGIKGETGEQGNKGDKGDRGIRGERGEKGEPGIEGVQGIPGLIGVVGPQGERGEKGEKGLIGDRGEKGNNGESGSQGIPGVKGESGVPGLMGDKGEQGLRGEKGANGDPGERGLMGISGPKGDRGEFGATGDRGPQGYKGDSGEKGDRGVPGLPGILGVKGEPGVPGPKGDTGEQGLRGEKGAKGDTGERGLEGMPGPIGLIGATGHIGPQGYKGDSGEKGDPGVPGLKGMKGDVGPAGKDCTLDELPGPEEGKISLGDSANPAISCAQLSSDGIYHINPSNPFSIKCVKGEMCLQSSEIDVEKEAIFFDKKPFWWNINFEKLYGIQESQMAYLLSQSTSVRQTLKYHCNNTEVIPSINPSKALLLSLWSGQLVEKSPTRESPIYYEVVENTCDEAKNTWESANIKMETNFTNRLPIVDIYIQDIRENQQAALELIELCFTYHKPTSP